MAEVRWSITASEDLRYIEEFVARDSSLYAVRLVDHLVEAVERLEPFPYSGRAVQEFQREELREVIFGAYRIVYVVQEGEVVTILRVVHSARDITGLAQHEPWTFG
jgi:plasmid stabilization system protein ParE